MHEPAPLTLHLSYRKGHLTLWGDTPAREDDGDRAGDGPAEGVSVSRARLRAALRALNLPADAYAILRCVAQPPDTGKPGTAAGWILRLVEACPLPADAAAWVVRWSAYPPPGGLRWGDELAYWRQVWRFAQELLRDGRIAVYRSLARHEPGEIRAGERDGPDSSPALFFAPAYEGEVPERLRTLTEAMPPTCRALLDEASGKQPAASRAVRHVLTSWVDYVARAGAEAVKNQLEKAPAAMASLPGSGSAEEALDLLRVLSAGDEPPLPVPPFAEESAAEAATWRRSSRMERAKVPLRLRIIVEPPALQEPALAAPDAQRNRGAPPWHVTFYAEHAEQKDICVPARNVWLRDGATAAAFRADPALLAGVLRRAAEQAREKSNLLQDGRAVTAFADEPDEVLLSDEQAERFLSRDVQRLERSGVAVDLPPSLQRSRSVTALRAEAEATSPVGHGMSSPVRLDWHLVLSDHEVRLETIEAMAARGQALLRAEGEWIRLNIREAALVARSLRKAERVSLREVVHMGLGTATPVASLPCGVSGRGWVGMLLAGAPREETSRPPEALRATLKAYQRDAFAWLCFLRRHGLGGCLALDMGLGKTSTTLAVLQHAVEERAGIGRRRGSPVDDGSPADEGGLSTPPALVVGPASVLYGWIREARRWTSLRVGVHHGPDRPLTAGALAAAAAGRDLVVTTYGTLREDADLLAEQSWGAVVLDEAQYIKGHARIQSRAALALGLKAPWRLALTGTPIENRLEDLWSIMEFLNPGYLGTRHHFVQNYQGPIEAGDDAARSRLVRLISPLLYRKKKTDSDVAAEVPGKLEVEVEVPLTPEQAALYEAVVAETSRRLGGLHGMSRKGAILAMITRLKMICNHPLQYLGAQTRQEDDTDGAAAAASDTATTRLEGRSHKLTRLAQMLEEVLDRGDRAVVFTQFTGMGELITEHLRAPLGFEAPFLRGSTSPQQREEMRRAFEAGSAPPVLVISLRAAGTGLDLPSARAVFHFDRWWNPSVEDQATDRAVRLGEEGLVQVYKFVVGGTIEERILATLDRKRHLVAAVVDDDDAGGGEAWITELSDEEIISLVHLDRASVVEDEPYAEEMSDEGEDATGKADETASGRRVKPGRGETV